jgi:hypothetical protein
LKTLVRALLIPAVVLLALAANAHAQNPFFNGIGSSALTIELGEAAVSLNPTTSCVWSTTTSGTVVATDTSTGSSLTDSGNSWVVWVPAAGNDCTTNATPAKLFGYLQTDSVVGDRCLFNAHSSGGNKCSISYAGGAGASPANLISTPYNNSSPAVPITEVTLPSAVASSLTSAAINAAGTDIRPEDALFATTRALTPCGSTTGGTGSIAPYLGLGYTNGSDILEYSGAGSGKFHVINFTLPSTYYVEPVGLDPMIFFVHSTDAAGTGLAFGHSSNDRPNASRLTIATLLDGSIGVSSAINVTQAAGNVKPITVWVREPLSGTYNTTEYNVPNTNFAETSQDVGVDQLPAQQNCSGTAVGSNPLAIANSTAGSFRYRAIGTGDEIKAVKNNNNSFGYAFWGTGNFGPSKLANDDTNRYLEIDGVDPLFTYPNVGTDAAAAVGGAGTPNYGHFPQDVNDYKKVDFGPLRLGNYPVWSLVRLVAVDGTTYHVEQQLSLAAGVFSAPGGSSPDFYPYLTSTGSVELAIERSHFAPPGITFSLNGGVPSNHGYAVGYGACTNPEAGGDVGGVIIRINPIDQAYCTDTGDANGITGRRN